MTATASHAATLRHLASKAASGRLELPSVPRVVRRLIEQLRAPDVDVGDFAAELAQEPQLSARVLRIANSAHYAGRRSVASLPEAVIVVGTRALRTLVIGCGLQAAFVRVPSVNLRQFWFDASVCAQAARAMASLGRADAEAAYLAGLLHEAGRLILVQALGPLPAELQPTIVDLHGAALAQAETAAWGLSHPVVGAAWLDELGFPQSLVEAVAMQLEPMATPAGSLARPLSLALALCASVGAGDSVEEAVARLDPALLEAMDVSPEALAKALESQYRELVSQGSTA